MILIVLNWLLIGYVAFMHGYWFRRIVNPSSDSPLFSLTLIWGLCALSVYTCVLLFFTSVGFLVLLFYVITAVLIHTRWHKGIVSQLQPLVQRMSSPFFIVVVLLLGCSLVLLSAHTSRIVDDWLYYTQTVLWYNEVGFVKGISNLLLPLGLGSSWHVLQSVFSFHFIPGVHLNDLNGFLVLLFSVFCYEQWMKKPGDYLLVFVFFLGLLVSIPYVEACSPDLPVILFTLIGGCLIYQGDTRFTDLLLLSAFGFSIKLSAVALVLFPFVYLFTRRDHEVLSNNRKRTIYFSVMMFCFFVLILVKNIYQTGYPFYPFHFFPVSQLDWITSGQLVLYYEQGIKAWGFADVRNLSELAFYQEMKPEEGFYILLSRQGYKGLINKMAFVTMAIYLITMVYRFVKFRDEKSNQYGVHVSLLTQLVIWFIFAPQYRFLLPVLLFQCSYIVSTFLPHFIGKRFSFNSITLVSILTFFILTLIYSILEPPWITTPALAKKYSPEKAKTELEFSELNGPKLIVAPSAYCFDYPLPCITQQQLGLINREELMLIRRDKDLREGFRLLPAGHIKPF